MREGCQPALEVVEGKPQVGFYSFASRRSIWQMYILHRQASLTNFVLFETFQLHLLLTLPGSSWYIRCRCSFQTQTRRSRMTLHYRATRAMSKRTTRLWQEWFQGFLRCGWLLSYVLFNPWSGSIQFKSLWLMICIKSLEQDKSMHPFRDTMLLFWHMDKLGLARRTAWALPTGKMPSLNWRGLYQGSYSC